MRGAGRNKEKGAVRLLPKILTLTCTPAAAAICRRGRSHVATGVYLPSGGGGWRRVAEKRCCTLRCHVRVTA